MFRAYSIRLLICILFISCGTHRQDPASPSQNANAREEDVTLFPITQYFLGQLRELDSLPVTPLLISETEGKKDSSWLRKGQLRQHAAPFLHPVIDSGEAAEYFSKSSFMDQTINSVTFSYDVIKSLPGGENLKQCIVYVDPDKNNVQRIYMTKRSPIPQGTLDSQLTWEAGKYFTIRTIHEIPGKPNVISEKIVKWDFDEDSE